MVDAEKHEAAKKMLETILQDPILRAQLLSGAGLNGSPNDERAAKLYVSMLPKLETFKGNKGKDSKELSHNINLYVAYFEQRMEVMRIPPEEWKEWLVNCLADAAFEHYTANNARAFDYSSLLEVLKTGPWSSIEDDESIRGNLFEPKVYSAKDLGGVHNTVKRFESDISKLEVPIDEVSKIVALKSKLPEDLRREVATDPSGQRFTDYETFRTFLLAKVNAMLPSFRRNKPNATNYVNGSAPNKRPNNGTNGGEGSSKQQRRSMDAGEGSSRRRSNDGKAKRCAGCGSTSHLVYERDANGKPICSKYDPSKARKGPKGGNK